MFAINCEHCQKQAHCRESSYVWLKAEKKHGIDRSKCKPTITWAARWAHFKVLLWSYYHTFRLRLDWLGRIEEEIF